MGVTLVDDYRLDTSGTVGYISIHSVTLEAIYSYSGLQWVRGLHWVT